LHEKLAIDKHSNFFFSPKSLGVPHWSSLTFK
jgi:hypothetical protein